MKNLFLFLFFALSGFTLMSQDVGITGSYSPNQTSVGGTSTLTVLFTNNDPLMSYSIGEVYVQITFPSNYSPAGAPTGNLTSYFNLVDQGGGLWLGYNTVVIPSLVGLLPLGGQLILNWQVTGNSLTPGAVTNLETNFDSLTDLATLDNLATAGLSVVSPMPITLSSFTGTSVDCDHVSLQWETASEINNEYMEILRSSDGKEFLSIGKVAGTNAAEGSKYSMEDHNYLLPNAKYYYVIRQVDFDGRMTHHEVIAVDHTCKDVPFGIDVYPNPATDKIHIALTGFGEDTEVKLQIVNNEGSLLRSISVNTSSVQDVSLDDLQAGIYQIQSTNLDKPLSARFIKIQ